MIVAAKVHHANIRIADLDRSLAFYRALGLDAVGALSLGPGYVLHYLGTPGSGPGSAVLELVVNETTDPSYDRSPGSGHLGLEVDDIGRALAALAGLGIEPEAPPAIPGGRAELNPVVFVRDPDGVRVELLQSPWPVPRDELPGRA
jgi:lactoylglutathione lyase